MTRTIWVLYFVRMFYLTLVDGYSRECDFNQTIIAKDGMTATFQASFREVPLLHLRMMKTSGAASGNLLRIMIFPGGDLADTSFFDKTFETRTRVSSKLHSDYIRIRIDLSNVTMNDNGTYRLSDYETACFALFILDGPSHPLKLVPRKKHHYLVSGDMLPNITCTSECNPPCNISWGNYSKGNTLSLGAVTTEDTGEYICTATRVDGQEIEQTISIYVAVRPSHHLALVPEQMHYYLVTGDTMPDITCTSDCNPPCNVSWGEHGKGNTLSLGAVTTESTGEYTCSATRYDGQNVKQSISIFVTENSYFVTAIACLATLQALTILMLGLLMFFIYKRKVPSCLKQHKDSKRNKTGVVTFSTSAVQGSENECYEDLKDGTKNKSTYSEVNLSITDNEAQPSNNKYENTRFAKKSTNN